MLRRGFLALPAALLAQSQGLATQWMEGPLPAAVAAECLVFPRAYTCCPDPGLGRGALETSRLPHALIELEAQLERLRASP